MKALTICQPYAHMIVRGEKLVENRNWPTIFRGPLAIHAGKSRTYLSASIEDRYNQLGDAMSFGAIVGTAVLLDVVSVGRVRMGDFDRIYPWLRSHTHAIGPWCWVLSDVARLAVPVPMKGAQGLWNFPDEHLMPNDAHERPSTATEEKHDD